MIILGYWLVLNIEGKNPLLVFVGMYLTVKKRKKQIKKNVSVIPIHTINRHGKYYPLIF